MDDVGIEVWRGGVNPWQCDLMGHLNVRFYVAHAVEGLAGLAAALGMPHAFAPRATSTLVVREHHIRFVKEARAGDALHLVAGVLEMTPDGLVALQVLVHSRSGEPAAVFQTRLAHARSGDAQPFPWPAAMRDRGESLGLTVPAGLGPRSLTPGEPMPAGTLDDAERLGLMRYGAGAFGPEHCDAFGRVAAHLLMGRMSDGASQAIALTRDALAETAPDAPPIGLAVVEYRLAYLEWPAMGDRFMVRSGVRSVEARRVGWSHWMLDPQTGRPWAAAQAVLVPFDLQARKAVSLTPEAQAALTARAPMIQG